MTGYTIPLGIYDWLIIGVYCVAVILLASWTKIRRKQNSSEYLLAGRNMNWLVVAIAVFATLFSTVSFVSIPGEAYGHGMAMMLTVVGQIVFLPIAIWSFLRFFFSAGSFTAYEYLERRYNPACRIAGASIFMMIRLFYTGAVFYSAAIIFESLVGWTPAVTILVIGAITILYTFTGGSRAIIWADVAQAVIIFCGIATILFRLLQLCGFDIAAVFAFAHANGKTFELLAQPEFYRFNVHDRINFWLILQVMAVGPFLALSCDQLVVQRLLSSRGYRKAVRATYMNYFISIPVIFMLYCIGTFLYYCYATGISELPETVRPDQVLGFFINTQLPSPLPGVIVTALLSALMSTIAGGVNSLVTVSVKDLLVSLFPRQLNSDQAEMKWCRILTVLFGVFSILAALGLVVLGQNIRGSLLEIISVWSNLWLVLLAAFLYGVFSTRISAPAILTGMCVGGVFNLIFPYWMYYTVAPEARWGFAWLGIPGFVLTLLIPPILSIWYPNRKNMAQLTIWTIKTASDAPEIPALPEKKEEKP